MNKYWLILLPLFLLACGIMAVPATVGSSTTAEISTVPAKKQAWTATFQPSQVILCVSAAESLNLRLAPSTSAEADSAGLQHGDRVTILGWGGSWYKVQADDGRTGWVKAEYIGDCK